MCFREGHYVTLFQSYFVTFKRLCNKEKLKKQNLFYHMNYHLNINVSYSVKILTCMLNWIDYFSKVHEFLGFFAKTVTSECPFICLNFF